MQHRRSHSAYRSMLHGCANYVSASSSSGARFSASVGRSGAKPKPMSESICTEYTISTRRGIDRFDSQRFLLGHQQQLVCSSEQSCEVWTVCLADNECRPLGIYAQRYSSMRPIDGSIDYTHVFLPLRPCFRQICCKSCKDSELEHGVIEIFEQMPLFSSRHRHHLNLALDKQ